MQWGTFAAHWHRPAITALSFWLRAGPAGPLSITTTLLRIRLISCSYSGAHASAVEVLQRHQPPQSTSGVPHTARDAGCVINVLFCRVVLIYFIDFTQGVITRIYILSPDPTACCQAATSSSPTMVPCSKKCTQRRQTFSHCKNVTTSAC